VSSNNVSSGLLGRNIALAMSKITSAKVRDLGFDNARKNAARIRGGKTIAELRIPELIENSSALVIAAGPSIHRYDTAGIIKRSQFNGTIIVTDSAMSWCLRNGIIPNLVVTLDPHPHRIARWFGMRDLTEGSILADDYFARQDMDPEFRRDQLGFNNELLELVNAHGPSMRIAISSSVAESVADRVVDARMDAYWWNPMYDDYEDPESLTRKIHSMNNLPCVNAGGNVGTACWVFAHAVLQKTHVGIVGMDFGYYSDTPYSSTQYYKEIVDLVGPDRLDDVFVRIFNPHLHREFYTDPAYLAYRDAFLEMISEASRVYNCTGGGILFGPGINWISLGDFLSRDWN